MKKMLHTIGLLTASLLWLTPSYICAMDRSACPMAVTSPSPVEECASACCKKTSPSADHQPCQTNSICGAEQYAFLSDTLLTNAAIQVLSVPVFVDDNNRLAYRPVFIPKSIRAPSGGHAGQDYFSNPSNLSPPSLA
jgi:hypothetical protein